MLVEFIDTRNALMEVGVNNNINESVKYTANTVSTLFNSGPFTIPLFTGAGSGTIIKTISVKALIL